MKPRSIADRLAGKPAQPSSAMNVVRSIRRIHKEAGIIMAPAPQLSLILKGIYRRLLKEFRQSYCTPDRKEPLKDKTVGDMVAIPTGTRCGHGGGAVTVNWAELSWVAFKAANALARFTGVRKDEVSVAAPADFDLSRASRANLLWRIGGVDINSPTPEQLRNLADDDLAIFVPPPSKCDFLGYHWGGCPCWLAKSPDPLCARDALRDYELAHPVSGAARRTTPLFCADTAGRPPLQSTIDRYLHARLDFVLGPELAAKHSFHSHRITLACKLLAKQRAMADDPRTRAMEISRVCHDPTRPNPEEDAAKRAGAIHKDATSVRTLNLPVIDYEPVATAIRGAAAEAEAEAQAESRRQQATV